MYDGNELSILTRLPRGHEWHVLALVDDGSGDVSVQDVDAEGEYPQLDQSVVALGLLRCPPTDDAQRYVENGSQALD